MNYIPPYSEQEVKAHYGMDVYKRLIADPCHLWRMRTGIELIHREPTVDEFIRIARNWKQMSGLQKIISDLKSMELFRMDNETHAHQLITMVYKIPYAKDGLI